MSDKIHQSSSTEYQVRVDGKPVHYSHFMTSEEVAVWQKACNENPGCYVDVVSVRTEIIINKSLYSLMEKHFKKSLVEL